MPYTTKENLISSIETGRLEGIDPQQAPVEPTEKIPFMKTLEASYKLNDAAWNLTKPLRRPDVDKTFDAQFYPIQTLEEFRPDLVGHASAFTDVNNYDEYEQRVTELDKELGQREILGKSTGLANLGAGLLSGVTDPLMLVPILGVASKVKTIGSIGYGIVANSATGLAAGTTREVALHNSQLSRTAQESVINIAAETAIGGIIGAFAGGIGSAGYQASKRVYAKVLSRDEFKIDVDEKGVTSLHVDDGVGAARSGTQDLGLANINKHLVNAATVHKSIRAPDLQAIMSPSESVQKLGEVFYNSNYIREKNLKGLASEINAQSAIFSRDQVSAKKLSDVNDLYLDYTGKGEFRSTFKSLRGSDRISKDDFSTRVWQSLTDEKRIDDIPQVQSAAKLIRGEMDKTLKELQELKLIGTDIDPRFAANYLNRVYNLDVLNKPSSQRRFVSKVSSWIQTHNKDGTVRPKALDVDEADEIALKALDGIRGETDAQISMASMREGLVSKGSFLKERQLLIPDSEIAEFLETDALTLFKNYSNSTSKMIETQKAFNRGGFKDLSSVHTKIKSERDFALKGIDEESKEFKKTVKSFNEQEKLATNMYRSMLGQLAPPGGSHPMTKFLLNFNYVTKLGGMTISSLPELAMPIFRHGLKNAMIHGYIPMIRSLKTAKLAKDQLNDLSGALDFESSNILRHIGGAADLGSLTGKKSAYERMQDATVNTFSKLTLINNFTKNNRRLESQISSASTIRTLKKGPKGNEIRDLASKGIGKAEYESILGQINKYSESYKGTEISNIHLWTDKDAAAKFRNAVQVDVESTILLPGVESTPFGVQRNDIAKIMFQFRSFMQAATTKIAISGMQRRDAKVLSGSIALVIFGMFTDELKDLISNKKTKEKSIDDMITGGISRSGMMGLLGTAMLDTTRLQVYDDGARYVGQTIENTFLGPSAGLVEGAYKAGQGITDGKITGKDRAAVMRHIPFMNLFYLKALTNRAFKDK